MTQHHRKHAASAHAGQDKSTTPTKAAVASSDNGHNGQVVCEKIRLCAYQRWEAAGKPSGDGVRFWLEAEQELAEGKVGNAIPAWS